MYVICIKDKSVMLGYKLYVGFKQTTSGETVLSDTGVITVFTFDRPDAKVVSGNIYFSAEYAENDMKRILGILEKGRFKLVPEMYIKSLADLEKDCLAWV